MQKTIELKIDDRELKEYFKKISQKVKNMSPLMKEIAGQMMHSVEENFDQEGRPKWPTLKQKRKKGGKILQKSGSLASSISEKVTSNSAIVGTNKIYAALHQFGGIIKPKKKKALFWPGLKRPVKQAEIPARPFLKLTNTDLKKITKIAKSYLSKI